MQRLKRKYARLKHLYFGFDLLLFDDLILQKIKKNIDKFFHIYFFKGID